MIARNHRALGLSVAALVFLADQVTKWIIVSVVRLQEIGTREILPIFELKWVENRGVSMGFLTADTNFARWLLVAMTAAIAIGVLIWMWREKARADVMALGLVLGGALGNILDRARFGYVVDFANLHFGSWSPFLVFNVADAAITIGVLLLVLRALLARDRPDLSENVNA
ncbi:signal peptidase II [Sphingomonas sp. 1P06PA]|uniref:signal peptidase II n=1 Tax=Sphingomonas sp. 1P06PA TaxID=554121 RepID=UPI0039A7542D